MEYVLLGKSNLKVSRFCLGTMMFGGKCPAQEATEITRAGVDAGVNFIDTADIYAGGQSETILGQALEGVRDQVVLATKAGMKVGKGINDQAISRFHVVRTLEASLRRLKTDRVDLFYIHWPTAAMNLDEMMRTLDDLTRQGKILYAACSNFPAWLAVASQWAADAQHSVPLVAGQYPYNLIERGLEIEVLPMAKAMGIGITVYRPLAMGVLTGKYLSGTPAQSRGENDARAARWNQKFHDGIQKLGELAAARGFASADAASAWVYTHPSVASVIVGVSSAEQFKTNLKGFDWKISAEERTAIGALFPLDLSDEAGGDFPKWRRSMEIV